MPHYEVPLKESSPHELFQYRFFTTASVWTFPWGTVCQECAAPTGCSPGLKICFRVGSLHGPCVLSGLGPPWAAVSFRASPHALVWCSPCACRVDICSTVDFRQLQEDNLHCHSFLQWLQWNFCSGITCPFLLQWPWHLQGWFSHVFSFLSHSCQTGFFYPFLNMLSQRCTSVTCGLTLGQQWVCPTQSSFRSLPTEPTPCQNLALNT